ncbi:MAG: CpsB/CapC family capsule biosynthesis tyrosine phosphatase [Bacteroidia bacterium]
MGILSRLFQSKKPVEMPLKWDMHNHILFGIDDGSKTLDNSLEMARQFIDLGYSKVIATPHIMSDYYPNKRENIEVVKNQLELALKDNHLPLEIDYAAEYYMDEFFYDQIKNKADILTFHNSHVLVETSFMNKPVFFSQLMFDLKTAGYKPVLAHPERYIYLQDNYEVAEQIIESGVKFQINLLSLVSHYSPPAKKLAQWIINNGHYHFLGTDAHTVDHLNLMNEVIRTKLFSSIDFSKVENSI